MMKYVKPPPPPPASESSGGGGKKKKKKQDLNEIHRVLYDLFEKKAVQEQTDERVQGHLRPTSGLADFMEDFYLRRYGLPKVARAELRKMVTSIHAHRAEDKRLGSIAILLGVEHSQRFSDEASHVFMRLLRNLYPGTKNIGEKLGLYTPAGGGNSHQDIPVQKAEAALLGSEAGREKPEKWVAPHLLSLASPHEIVSGLLSKGLDALPTKTVGPDDCVDLDDLISTTLNWVLETAQTLMDKLG